MSSLRDRMMSKTAEVRAAKDIQLDPQQEKATSPRTAPGMAAALASAQQRIAQLEQAGPASEAPVSEIVPNPWQPRQVFNDAKLVQLAESIREAGSYSRSLYGASAPDTRSWRVSGAGARTR